MENPDIDDFTATALQTDFVYTFASPTEAADVAVWLRGSSSAAWDRAAGGTYSVDLDTKTVTFALGQPAGTLVRINRRHGFASIASVAPHLIGQSVYVHGDGLPIGLITATDGDLNLDIDRFDFELQAGLRQVPRIVLHPYKGRGEMSPTMHNQRIFQVLLQMIRTGDVAVSAAAGGAPRPVALRNYDSGVTDATLEEVLFTGSKRVGGLGQWQREPTVEITQLEPMPFLLQSVTYDIRF
jgi:hypothetical protein